MRKFRNAKTGVMMLAAILAISGCGKTEQETTTQPKVYVSEEQVETEVTTITTTEPISKSTSSAETTQAVIKDNSEWGKVDEIYNTNFMPNVSDNVAFDVVVLKNDNWDGTSWRKNANKATDEYSISLDNNTMYSDIISINGFELVPLENNYKISINQENVTFNRTDPADYRFEYCGIHHIPEHLPANITDEIYKTDVYAPIIIEIANTNGSVVEAVSTSEEYRVKAIGSTLNNSSLLLNFVITNENGNKVEIKAGDLYNDISHQLYKLFEGADIDMDIDSNTKYIVVKNNLYTLFIERNERDKVGSIILINNNV